MTDDRRFIIIGASLAGAKAAETLREEGFEGRIALIGEEPVRPYERPPLSKEYLQGKAEADVAFVHDPAYYDKHNIDLRLSTPVRGLEPAGREVVLASGATPRRLAVPGADLAGVHYLRTMADAERLRMAITGATRVVVIGAGWIGCEVAASARQLGADVALVELGRLPLERVLGPELGAFYRDVHADHGVELHFDSGIETLRGAGRVEEVRLADGTVLAADVVVAGVGVIPRVELAEVAGLALDNGVITDEYLAASAAGVFAAGDVASAWHPVFGRRIRLEHWSSALNQGPAAAMNMLGRRTPYEQIPYFYSDQYDVGMEYSGHAPGWDQVVFRGDPASREFIAFWLAGGRVVAGMNVNVWDVADSIAALVAAGGRVDLSRLLDPDVELATLAG